MQDNKINDLEIEYTFKIYLEETEVCRIHYKETPFNGEAKLEVFDEDKLPIEIAIGTRESSPLLYFLKDRVLPSNRMFLDKYVKDYGISTDDWIGKMKLNKGRVYEDEYWIEVDDVKDQASVSTGQVATEQVATEQVATGIDISEGSVDC